MGPNFAASGVGRDRYKKQKKKRKARKVVFKKHEESTLETMPPNG